jgi:DHA1 family tetracycline resistance protein-like MFS transporter
MPGSDQTVVRVLFFATLIEIIGFGMVLPILPLLLTEPSSPFFLLPDAYTLKQGFLFLGALIAFYPLGQFFATPVLGQLSDKYGRRPLLLLSISGSVVANIIFGIAILTANIPAMFLSRALNGLTGGNIAIVQAGIADVSDTAQKATNFGRISAAFGFGFMIGPFLGGLLSTPDIVSVFNASTPFFTAAVFSAFSAVLIYAKLHETSPQQRDIAVNWKQSIDNILQAFRMPERRALFTTSFLYYCGFGFLTSFMAVFLIQRFGFNQLHIGNYFLYIGIIVVLTQLVIVPRFYSRFQESRVMPLVLFATGFSILILYPQHALIPFLVLTPLFSVSNGLTRVGILTLISNTGSDTDQGLILGINSSLRALATAIPSALAGAAAALFAPETPILIAGSIITATAIGYLVWKNWLR